MKVMVNMLGLKYSFWAVTHFVTVKFVHSEGPLLSQYSHKVVSGRAADLSQYPHIVMSRSQGNPTARSLSTTCRRKPID